MSTIAKASRSIVKKDLKTQTDPLVAFKTVFFAHQAALGDTQINLGLLSTPSEMATKGYTPPSASDLAAIQLLGSRANLRLRSSLRAYLEDFDAYQITGQGSITLNFTAEDGEIFYGTISETTKNGVQVIDGKALSVTGTLLAGQIDFNVGQPFSVNKYPGSQIGDVIVNVNGQQALRNVSNATATALADGHYQELDLGNGLAQVIRFNEASAEDRVITVVSNGMIAERPTDSMRAEIEYLAGRLNVLIPTVAALAGVPQTDFISTPTYTDLKAFGDRVLTVEQRNIYPTGFADSGTFPLTLIGVSGAGPQQATITVRYAKTGNVVVLYIPDYTISTSTAGNHTSSVGAIPSQLRPSVIQNLLIGTINAGGASIGGFSVFSDGRALVYADQGGSNFSITNANGVFRPTAVTYLLN